MRNSVGPGSDIALALYRVAPLYSARASTSRTAPVNASSRSRRGKGWNAQLKAIVAHACTS